MSSKSRVKAVWPPTNGGRVVSLGSRPADRIRRTAVKAAGFLLAGAGCWPCSVCPVARLLMAAILFVILIRRGSSVCPPRPAVGRKDAKFTEVSVEEPQYSTGSAPRRLFSVRGRATWWFCSGHPDLFSTRCCLMAASKSKRDAFFMDRQALWRLWDDLIGAVQGLGPRRI